MKDADDLATTGERPGLAVPSCSADWAARMQRGRGRHAAISRNLNTWSNYKNWSEKVRQAVGVRRRGEGEVAVERFLLLWDELDELAGFCRLSRPVGVAHSWSLRAPRAAQAAGLRLPGPCPPATPDGLGGRLASQARIASSSVRNANGYWCHPPCPACRLRAVQHLSPPWVLSPACRRVKNVSVSSISSSPISEKDTAGQPAARNARWSVVGYSVPGAEAERPLARAASRASSASGPCGVGVIIHGVSPQAKTSKFTYSAGVAGPGSSPRPVSPAGLLPPDPRTPPARGASLERARLECGRQLQHVAATPASVVGGTMAHRHLVVVRADQQ